MPEMIGGEQLLQLAGQLVAACFLTAFVEELAFRGILTSLLARRFAGEGDSPASPNALVAAAAAGALVFALLHVVSDALSNVDSAILTIQALLKLVQTGLFGFLMGCLFLKARAKGASFVRALTFPILIHFAFDLVYFAPVYFSTGSFPSTYLTGSYGDLAILLFTSLLMLPMCAAIARRLKGEVLPFIPKNAE